MYAHININTIYITFLYTGLSRFNRLTKISANRLDLVSRIRFLQCLLLQIFLEKKTKLVWFLD